MNSYTKILPSSLGIPSEIVNLRGGALEAAIAAGNPLAVLEQNRRAMNKAAKAGTSTGKAVQVVASTRAGNRVVTTTVKKAPGRPRQTDPRKVAANTAYTTGLNTYVAKVTGARRSAFHFHQAADAALAANPAFCDFESLIAPAVAKAGPDVEAYLAKKASEGTAAANA